MAVTINSNGTITGIAAGGLPDGVVDTDTLAADAVTAAKVADNAVTTAKINADAVTAAKVADDVINSEHLVDGGVDNAHLATGIASSKLSGALPAISGASLTSLPSSLAPYFSATGGEQDVSDGVITKLVINGESNDSDGCYNTTNYRFTPNKAGRYFVMTTVDFKPQGADRFHNCYLYIYKNGSAIISTSEDDYDNYFSYSKSVSLSDIVNMNGSTDYIEIYGSLNVTTGSPDIKGRSLAFFVGA